MHYIEFGDQHSLLVKLVRISINTKTYQREYQTGMSGTEYQRNEGRYLNRPGQQMSYNLIKLRCSGSVPVEELTSSVDDQQLPLICPRVGFMEFSGEWKTARI